MSEQVFVTRERELAQLQALLERTLAGQGQVCFVAGVAGTGKSALITEFGVRAQAVDDELVVAIGNCDAQTGIGDPYLPFREILALLSGDTEAKLAQGVITPENANRLGAHLIRSGQVLVEIAPDLINTLIPGAKLLALLGKALIQKFGWMEQLERMMRGRHDKSKAAVVGSLAAEATVQQSHIFEQYTDALKALAAEQPLILVLDDLQWADAASISLLFHLTRRIGESRILLIGTYRSDEVALGRGGERHPLVTVINEVKHTYGDVVVDLDAAQEAEGRQFVNALLASEPNRLSDQFREALFHHTQGHPLFTVELLRHLQAQDDLIKDPEGRWIEGSNLDWEALPARVEGVIAERIGRLETELLETLTVASVEGERFTAEVVAGVRKVDDRALIRRLNAELDKQHHLVGALEVRQVNQQRLCFYGFRHNLFQRYLYNSIPAGELAYLHEDVGVVSEKLYKERTGEIAVQLAWHFEEAGLSEKAVGYLLQAGTQAIQLSAHRLAIGQLHKALEMLKRLPQTPEHLQQELKVQIALGVALTVTNASSAPEIAQVYARASELCRQLGDIMQLFPSVHGLWRYHLVCGHHQTAGDLAEQMLRQAESVQDADLLMEACLAAGTSSYFMGDLNLARERLERGIALYSPEKHRSHMTVYGHDVGVLSRSFLVWALAHLGYPDQALQRAEEAIALAAAQAHPYSQGFAMLSTALVLALRREYQATQERSETSLALCAKHGFPAWIASSTIAHGWSLVYQGKSEEGIAQIRQGYAGLVGAGAALGFSYFLCLLADSYRVADNREAGLAAISEGLAAVQENDEHFYEAELYRVQGELLLIPSTKNGNEPSAAAAEASFRQAFDLAQRRNERMLQLRAAISLLKLQNKQAGKQQIEEARQSLLEIYQWFTEGGETADLQEAKALLAQSA